MYRIVKGDPRTPWRPKPSKIAAIIDTVWASEDVQTLSGAAQTSHVRVKIVEAMVALEAVHEKKMAGRLAHWQTTCRLDGCAKQPRTGKPALGGRKVRRRDFVFCPRHAGLRNRIEKADYNRLQNDANLHVIIAGEV